MKKICLLLVVALLLSCCLVSCGGNSEKTREAIEIGVQRYLIAKMQITDIHGDPVSYLESSCGNITHIDGQWYRVDGWVTVKKYGGGEYIATFDIILGYDEENDDYTLNTLELGDFYQKK